MPMAGSPSSKHRRSLISVVLLVTLVTSSVSWLGRDPTPAGGDQIADLKAQATTIAQQLVREQLQVGAYQQQVSVAAARVAADGQAITQLDTQIAQDQHQISAKADQVRTLAVRSYMDYGTGVSSGDAALFTSDPEHAQVASEYSAIAVGNITTALAELRTAQRTFQTHQATLQRQQGQDRADQAHKAAFLGQADATQHQLVALQSTVTGQLAAAVAQQSAAQSAAAAAAVAAAQRSATKAPSGTAGKGTVTDVRRRTRRLRRPAPGPRRPPRSPAGTHHQHPDPALNPFLQCVVQAESGGDYQAVSPDGLYMGAFQFAQPTWNTAAVAAGRPDLVDVAQSRLQGRPGHGGGRLYALDGQLLARRSAA